VNVSVGLRMRRTRVQFMWCELAGTSAAAMRSLATSTAATCMDDCRRHISEERHVWCCEHLAYTVQAVDKSRLLVTVPVKRRSRHTN